MNVVDRCVTVATRVDAAGVGWITAHPGERGDGLATQQEILDALAELIADPAVRTIIIAGQPLAVLNGSHSCEASPKR